MALFGKKEKPSTLEEIKRAYESLSDDDKKSFQESIKDHVDESVAAQKEDSGEKTEQSAEAEIHEAEGAEHAAGKGDVEDLGENDDTPEEQAEDEEQPYKNCPTFHIYPPSRRPSGRSLCCRYLAF